MSMGLNRATLLGNVGRDPEVRQTAKGTKVANFTLATSRQWTDEDGEKKSRTEWHRVAVWGGMVHIVEAHVHKGSRIYLAGEIQTRTYTDAHGKEQHSTEIVLQGPTAEIILLDSKAADASAPARTTAPPAAPLATKRNPDNDEIPF